MIELADSWVVSPWGSPSPSLKIDETPVLYTVSEGGSKRIEPVGDDAVRIEHDLCRRDNAHTLSQ